MQLAMKSGCSQAYRADIDGLRALAVITVLLFHMGLSGFDGGFIGVDIFFVISGYLITRNIRNEFRHKGQFDFINFYQKRARRLMPALYFTIFFTFLLGALLLSSDHMRLLGKSSVAQLLFKSNVYFWRTSGYFDIGSEYKPLLHTWSLSVEEQFYFIWPFLLVFLLGLKSRRRAVAIFMGCLFASFTINLIGPMLESWGVVHNAHKIRLIAKWPSSIFYLPFFRFFEFLIGASVLWLSEKYPLKNAYKEVVFIVALLTVAYSVVTFNGKLLFPFYSMLLPVVATAMLIFTGQAVMMGRAFNNPLAIWVGRRSYSIYLVHWPLLVYLKCLMYQKPNAIALLFYLAGVFSLANFMYAYIELPFRQTGHFKLNQRGGVQVISGLFVILFALSKSAELSGWSWRIPDDRKDYLTRNYKKQEDAFCDKSTPADAEDLITCRHHHAGAKTIYVWGDSHARHLVGGIANIYPNASVSVMYYTSCMPQSGLFGYFYDYEGLEAKAKHCVARNHQALAFFAKQAPSNIIIHYYHRLGDASNEPLIHASQKLIATLKGYGHNVKIISDVVRPGIPMVECLSKPAILSDNWIHKKCQGNRRLAKNLIREFAMLERRLGSDTYINMSERFCPQGNCIYYLSQNLYRDENHLTVYGSTFLMSAAKSYLTIS